MATTVVRALRDAFEYLPPDWLVASRDAENDVGTTVSTESENRRSSLAEVVAANCKRAQEAVRTLEELLKTKPDYASADQALYEIGWALKSLDKPAEAAQAFERLAKRHGNSSLAAEAWFHVGEDRYERKEFGEAAVAYAKARAAKPSYLQ